MKINLINATEQQLQGRHTIHATYRKDDKGFDILDAVVFEDGVADCEDNLAQYLIDKQLAKPGAEKAKAKDKE